MKPVPRFSKADLPRLGQHIRNLRTAAGLTRKALAERAGLAEGTLGALESGRTNPALPTVLALSAALGTTIDRMISASACGQAAVTRAGSQGVALEDGVLTTRVLTLAPATAKCPPDGAAMMHVIAGSLRLTTAADESILLAAGDGAHARAGALASLDGAARVLIVTDRRTEREAG